VKVGDWVDREAAGKLILASIDRLQKK